MPVKPSEPEIISPIQGEPRDFLKPRSVSPTAARKTTDTIFDRFADDLGPSKVIHLYEPSIGLKAIVVVDNTSLGPAIGGVRMAPDVNVQEAFRLARAMTLKNAIAGIPHGGGKSVIFADPKKIGIKKKERLIRAFARSIKELTEYIPGPDMGTNEASMAWVQQEIQRCVGLPKTMGGIPLDEIGATGFGCAIASQTACRLLDIPIQGARVAIQGFGAVGKHAARFLVEMGARIVAVADSQGTVRGCDGLNIDTLWDIKNKGGSVIDYPDGETSTCDDIVGVLCDIWIPAARPDIINLTNVDQLNCQLIVPGANIPISNDAKNLLFHRGIHVIPDFVANSGGVICGSVEYHGGTKQQAMDAIEAKIRANVEQVLSVSMTKGITEEEAAKSLALERIKKAQVTLGG